MDKRQGLERLGCARRSRTLIEAARDESDENTSKDDPRLVELDVLSALVEEYEKEHYPIEIPSLPQTIISRMREMNCSQKELAVILGISAPRLSDILTGKKDPTYQQARTISDKLSIDPAIVLAV